MPKPRSNLTPTQQAYLDYIERYIALHGRAPAEHEMQAHFQVTPPSVHRMVVVLEEKGAIRRQPGVARSIEVVPNARRLAGQSVETVVTEDLDEKTPATFVGRWRIVETEGWTREVLDEAVPANITFDARGQGHFQMVHVEGGIDCRFRDGRDHAVSAAPGVVGASAGRRRTSASRRCRATARMRGTPRASR